MADSIRQWKTVIGIAGSFWGLTRLTISPKTGMQVNGRKRYMAALILPLEKLGRCRESSDRSTGADMLRERRRCPESVL